MLKRFFHYRYILYCLAVYILFFFDFSSVFADGRLPTEWKDHVDTIRGVQTPISGTSTEIINTLFIGSIVPILKYVFIGVALLFLGLYSYYLSIGMGEEEQLTEQRKNFLFAIVGFSIMGMASKIVEIINPVRESNSQLVDLDVTESVVKTVITYLEMGLGTIAIVVIFYGALQMIMSNGDEERSGVGKNILKYGFLGLVVVILADVLVTTVFYPHTAISGEGVGNAEATEFITQGVGVIQFLLQFLAIGIFIAFVVSGFLYLTAGENDEQAEKAKKTLLWTVVGTLLVISSYAILTFFTPG